MTSLENDTGGGGGSQGLPATFAWYLRDMLTDKKLYKVDKQIFRIGRSVEVDIICRCQCVSRNHATLTLQDNGMLLIKDEGVSDYIQNYKDLV